jgi:RHS repeat-associated protein
LYDGKGLRVLRVSNISGATTNTVYIFSGLKVIAEYDYATGTPSPTSPSREYIYSGGALITKIDSSSTKYYHQDHLSNRLVTDSSGNTSAQMGHFPFGESWYTASADKLIFTTYERNGESGNDYAMARYYVSRLGRFASRDPQVGTTSDPQSLNRYAYVENNPVNLVDPFGEYAQYHDDTEPWMDPGSYSTWEPDIMIGGGSGSSGPGGGNVFNVPTKQPPPPPGYKQCIEAALREVLAKGEMPPGEADPYNLLVDGHRIADVHDPDNNPWRIFIGQASNGFHLDPQYVNGHPGVFVQVHAGDPQQNWSSAFGRYQIVYKTSVKLGFTDFSPAGQDAAANTMLNAARAVAPAMAGVDPLNPSDRNFARAIGRMGDWASMPGSRLPGPKISMQTAFDTFEAALNGGVPECL